METSWRWLVGEQWCELLNRWYSLDTFLKYPSSSRSYKIFKVGNALGYSHVRTSCVIVSNFCLYFQINNSGKKQCSVLLVIYFLHNLSVCVCISCTCLEIVVHLEWIWNCWESDYKLLLVGLSFVILRMKLALKKSVVWAQRLICAQDTITSLSLQQSKCLNYCKYLQMLLI